MIKTGMMKTLLVLFIGIAITFGAGCRDDSEPDMDGDRDGYSKAQGDCNDSDAKINPGATEICGDGIDQNCNGSDLVCPAVEDRDQDKDGYSINQGDWDDTNPKISPAISGTCGGRVPVGYKTGQWPTFPAGMSPIDKTNILMESDPNVTMISAWEAELSFKTAIPTPAVTAYYGVYEPDASMPWARYREWVKEALPTGTTETTEHKVALHLSGLSKTKVDIADLTGKKGGVVAYRIEVFSKGVRTISGLLVEPAGSRFYDGRFEFYNGKLVPTVKEGPFVNQITETGAIISWDTDKSVSGTVIVDNVGTFNGSTTGTHFEVEIKNLIPGKIYNYSVQVTDGTDTTTTRKYYFKTPASNAKNFAFAILGDSRGGFLGGAEYDKNGVNAFVLRNLVTDAYNRGAEFIINTGDLVTGYTSSPADFELELASYKDVLENVGHYIPIYNMMGNHESVVSLYVTMTEPVAALAYWPMLMFDREGIESVEYLFGKHFVHPTNGPDINNYSVTMPAGKTRPTYKENVYYFDYGNCRFVVLNTNYWYCGLPEKFGGNLEGYIMDDQKAWAINVLNEAKTNSKISHIFLLAQEPLFPVGGQSSTGMWYKGGDPTLNAGYDRAYVPERRDEIWRAFVATGKAVSGNFGDEHNYSRTFIEKDRKGNAYEKPAWQIVSGGGGAPVANLEKGLPWSDNVKKYTAQNHYTLLRVDGNQVKLEVFNMSGILIESLILKSSDGIITANPPTVDPVAVEPRNAQLQTLQLTASGPSNVTSTGERYKTGQWPTYPTTLGNPQDKSILLLDSEPHVELNCTSAAAKDCEAEVSFTTAIETPAVTIYYGVYDPDGPLPMPRFRYWNKETLEGNSKNHHVALHMKELVSSKNDISNISGNNGGIVVYRIEIYSSGVRTLGGLPAEPSATRLYDRRFEFYDGKLYPTITEGPLVNLITQDSATISWKTDISVYGTVIVDGEGYFATSSGLNKKFEVELTPLLPGKTYTYSVQISNGSETTVSKKYSFKTPAKNLTNFKFAILGDSRGAYLGGGEDDYGGVNATVLRPIITDAYNKGAEFIVNTGDLATGYTSSPLEFEMEMTAYKKVIENVGHYIPFYAMMGNHESVVYTYFDLTEKVTALAYWPMIMFDREGNESAEFIFGNEFVHPTNGPDPDNVAANTPQGKSMPPYKENVYYFDYGKCRFLVMNNNYWYCGLPEKYGANLEGFVLDDQYAWLVDMFDKTKLDTNIDYLFLLAQEPLFPVGFQSNTGMWYYGGDPAKNGDYNRRYVVERRDQIWNAFLATGKAIAGTFGDEHNYSRTLISKDRNGNPFAKSIWQIVSGGAGAPVANLERGLPWSDGVKTYTSQYHYTLYKVDGSKITLEVYNINGEKIDSVELTGSTE